MSFEAFQQYPPVDVELVDRIVCKLKSQGIFDQFRKDCMADVDTKPAYQNLQQRVNGTVATFLATQTWQQDLNKTQLRESLKRHVQQGFLEVGVDRIVDQVVNPKVFTIFMPKVEDVVYDCLGLEKPKHPPPSSTLLTRRKLTLVDLLPKDLDPVSPDSDNLSFDDDETKDETNNNESLSKLDMSNDSQVSGISDLSSHMGDSFKETQENHVDSNTVKSDASIKENSNELHFENFENLSEKIKQAEIGHNPVVSSQTEVADSIESRTVLSVEQNDLTKDNNKEDISMEIDSISNSTFEDTKIFTNKVIKDDTCSRSLSEDSMSCSSISAKLKKEKSVLPLVDNCANSLDKSEVGTPCKESSLDKDIKAPIVSEDIEMKTEEKVSENKEIKKIEESKDKKHRDSSSSSSKASKSSSDRRKPSESKHRSSNDNKDDVKQTKEKIVKDDKDKEKLNKDEKDKSNKHKEDRHSKDKHRDKNKYLDRNKEKYCEKKKDKTDSKDSSEKDRKNEKELEKDKYKVKEKNEKDRSRHDKEKYRQEKDRPEKDKERHEKEKDRCDKEKDRHDKEKEKRDKHEKSKRDKEKLEKNNKYDSKDKDRDRNDREKDKNEKERNRDRERGKVEKEKENKIEKDKDSARFVEDKNREEKKKESKKYDKQAVSSSLKKDDCNKNDAKDKNKRSDENSKEKSLNNKVVGKSEEERRERKRKAERCNDDIKLKEARRSWDRDSSGGNGRGHASQKPSTSEYQVTVSSGSTKEKQAGECSNHQKTSERKLEPVSGAEEPSDVDKILMKINSSIEESQNVSVNDEHSVKKPKIAKNIYEIKKIMLARKNLARQMRSDKKKKETLVLVKEADVTDTPSTAQSIPQNNPEIREENKENIKTGQLDKMKSSKVCQIKGKFNGFLESDIEKSRNYLQNFRTSFFNYCTNMGITVTPTDDIENVDFTAVRDFNEELLDDNLNKLKPKSVSLERRKTFPEDKQVSKTVESIISGMNGCYVLLQDCTEVVEAMRNASQQQQPETPKRKAVSSPVTKPNAPRQHPSPENSKAIGSLRMPKKTVSSNSSANKAVPILPNCVVELQPEVVANNLQNHPLDQQDTSVKNGASDPASLPDSAKQQLKQDQQENEPSSPGVAISVALNPFLNDSILNHVEETPSATLTEAMLDNLMRESSMIVEDEGFEDSDSSDHEYLNQFRDTVKKLEENHELYNEKELIRHITSKTNNTFESLPGETSVVLNDGEPAVPLKKEAVPEVHTTSCDMVTPEKGSPQDRCEDKSMKRRNQRLCRSASQRYDSTDLYKPRPVLPQNAKRVRAPRSVSSEELSLKEQFEVSPPKKRAR